MLHAHNVSFPQVPVENVSKMAMKYCTALPNKAAKAAMNQACCKICEQYVQLEWQQNTCWNAKDSMIIYTIPNDEKEIVYWFTHYLCCRQPKHTRIWLLSCICIWYTIVIIVHCDMDTVTICIHIISYTNKNMTLWLWYQSICQSLQLHNMISGT